MKNQETIFGYWNSLGIGESSGLSSTKGSKKKVGNKCWNESKLKVQKSKLQG